MVNEKDSAVTRLNILDFVDSMMVDIDRQKRDVIKVTSELSPQEEKLIALKEEFEQLEKIEENIRQQVAEKRKNLLQIKQDSNLHCNAYKIKKDHEKQLKKTIQSLKKDIDHLKGNPLTEKDQEKLMKCKKKLVWYEKCTGVVFDYSSKDSIKGFVQNPVTNYLNTFSIEKNCDVEKALWLESTEAGALHCSQHLRQEKQKV